MQTDKTTLQDLSFIRSGGEDIFQLMDHTVTQAGREALRLHLLNPPQDYETLQSVQAVVRYFVLHSDAWSNIISNGTVILLEQFFETADHIALPPSGLELVLGSFFQKILNKDQYTFTQFSISHLADFVRGCNQFAALLSESDLPELLRQNIQTIKDELEKHILAQEIADLPKDTPYAKLVRIAYRARRELKSMVYRLIKIYALLDCWHSMAVATVSNRWNFPALMPSAEILLSGTALFHPLLQQPIAYNIHFDSARNFLFLTGANMSGKTTFMRTLGVASLLAHLGMGVPAASFQISFMEGIVTNMHIEDNLILGESYFLAEIKRMKQTAEKIQSPKTHIVLMDELFKGTNVHDAYECTKAVVQRLLLHKNHIMVLSTHLYEVAQEFNHRKEISFQYFETDLSHQGDYRFTYQLKDGISNDRIGYRILLQEKVLELLEAGIGTSQRT
ncbi:MAG: hypothetical protein JST52_07170 [Bacteroidetes bacterium]|nr:hypothetical protein [Bacteroidota bacterium]MBS1739647.1 hypothetical protein [Bacteroidota bacterium]